MRFGMLHLFENPVGKTEHEIIGEQMELMRAAEEVGFDSVWPAEHHFTEYGYCASPALSLAAIATQTRRLRLGTGVVVLPLNHPLRVAEDYAFLDHLSDGRVDLGIGRGYQPLEFQRYGVDQSTTREQFDEALQVLRQAWTRGKVDFEGKHFRFRDVPIRPAPVQKPHPPIWMAALSPETFELAGRYGLNLLYGSVFGLVPEMAALRRADYHRGLGAGGHPAEERFRYSSASSGVSLTPASVIRWLFGIHRLPPDIAEEPPSGRTSPARGRSRRRRGRRSRR
jgi:alkanesulfonate monooxygenase SsuD/methylene tetrahydromethanopterin reductase-like flavin-dependent oxidoreductase (luciferase family)